MMLQAAGQSMSPISDPTSASLGDAPWFSFAAGNLDTAATAAGAASEGGDLPRGDLGGVGVENEIFGFCPSRYPRTGGVVEQASRLGGSSSPFSGPGRDAPAGPGVDSW
jgi:hypothetical protein